MSKVMAGKRCAFCGREVRPGFGVMFVKNDGTILWFCSSKCRKCHGMGRDPRRYKWTERYEKGGIKRWRRRGR